MIFTSFEYLILFLPIVVFICYCLSKISRTAVIIFLIVSSLYFYGSWNPWYLYLLIGSVLFNFTVGKFIGDTNSEREERKKERKKERKILLYFGVISNIALLGYFKYTNFFIDSFNFLFSKSVFVENIVLPLAISFFTFQQIAWLVDQSKKEAPDCNFLEYCCAVTFFPHLIAGPIVQYHDLIPQLKSDNSFKPSWNNICNSLFLIAIGTFKKIVIADSLAVFATQYFDNTTSLTSLQAWFGLGAYTMQIYFDFSGYCDIAIGSALLIGIRLPINFDNPYRSKSIREFWRRWHITLGYFLTKYVYFPLGGSRCSLKRACFNILLVMFISGFWHGAGICFILWGIMHGVGMVVNRIYNHLGLKLSKAYLSIPLTFFFTSLAWVLFRAKSFEVAIGYYKSLFFFYANESFALPHFFSRFLPDNLNYFSLQEALGLSNKTDVYRLLFFISVSFVIAFVCPRAQVLYDKYIATEKWYSPILILMSVIALILSFYKMVTIPYTEFIYFNF